MTTINNHFEHIYCINLDKRTDRWAQVQEQLIKYQIEDVERFSATDGSKLLQFSPLNNGEKGINLTYIRLLKDAIKKGYENILILEDDVVFDEDINNKFETYIKQVPNDWDMLYIGGNHMLSPNPVIPVTKNIVRLNHTYANHCVAIKHNLYGQLINLLYENQKQVDVYCAQLQKVYKAYGFAPALAWQRESFSDIQGVVINYDFWLKR